MADISITKYKTKVTKPTASPSNPGYPTSDPIDPVNPPASGAGGGGVNTFLQLTDTPASYTGQAGLFPRVNSGETGLEFFNPLSLPITGYTVGSNTALADTDTILGAFGKVQGQINAKIGGTIASGQVAFGTGVNAIGGDTGLVWDNTNKRLQLGGTSIRPIYLSRTGGDSIIRLNRSNENISSAIGGIEFSNFINQVIAGIGIFTEGGNDLGGIRFFTSSNNNQTSLYSLSERWRINNTGNLIAIGGNSIASTSNGNINLTPNGTGLVGIATTSPTNTLDVNGTARIRTLSNATGEFVTASATGVLQKRTAAEVVSDLGIESGLWTATGSDIYRNSKVLVGATSFTDTGAKFEVSGRVSQVGTGLSVFIGQSAGQNDDLTNNVNVYIGYQAGQLGTSADGNTFVGYTSGRNITNGFLNSAYGYESLLSNQTGDYNTAIGYRSAYVYTGNRITAVGTSSGQANTTGQAWVAIGNSAGLSNTTGSNWTALGYEAGIYNQTGSNWTAIGYGAGGLYTGGGNATSFSNGVYLGYLTKVGSAGATNEIVIGYLAEGQGSNTVVLGNSSIILTILRGKVNMAGLPTSSAGLNAGDVWNNGGVLNIV